MKLSKESQISGIYYGADLRHILTDCAPITERHEDRMRRMFWRFVVIAVAAAVSYGIVAAL